MRLNFSITVNESEKFGNISADLFRRIIVTNRISILNLNT